MKIALPIAACLLAVGAVAWRATRTIAADPLHGAYADEVTPDGTVREYAVTAGVARVPLFDGQPVEVWAYNGQVPGPTLRVRLGQTLRIRFTNRLPQATTIHWHGMRLPNRMDGVPGVTQPPVEPGESFVYEFTPKDAGTFWFHPHLRASEQVERGLYGVLIVEDRQPAPWSRDVTWVIDDWLMTPAGVIAPEFNTRHDLAHDGRWGNVMTVNGNRQEVLRVRPGERIRLRLLNVANGRIFAPDLGGVDARVIAFDGLYAAEPLAATRLELAPGNRVDLDITIPKALRGQRVQIVDRYTRRPIPLAEIAIDGDPVETPAFASPARATVPAWREAAALEPRQVFRLDAQTGGEFGIQWTLNGRAFDHAAHAGAAHAGAYTLPYGELSKVRFVNDSARLHPMHLHGMFFKVLTRNGLVVEERHFRDTVLVGPRETLEIGVVPRDRGRWMMHCHILEHAESGMMTLIDVP